MLLLSMYQTTLIIIAAMKHVLKFQDTQVNGKKKKSF